MSSPRPKWMLCLFWFQFVFMTNTFSLIDSARTEKQIIILRGIIKNYEKQDFFSYKDDNECGNIEGVYKWCQKKNADELKPFGYKCSCVCQYNFKTFLSKEGRCLNESYLTNLEAFGTGKYMFNDPPSDLSKSGKLKILVKKCNGCQIDTVQYFTGDHWNNITGIERWNISKNGGFLMWPTMISDADGRILKIQLKNCNTSRQCEWGQTNPKFFLKSKSKGNSSMDSKESPSTPLVSTTMVPTPTLTSGMTSIVQTSVISKPPLRVSSTASCVAASMCFSIGPGPYDPKPTEHKKEKQSNKVTSTIGVSVGAVLACFAVFVGIIVIYIMCKRRKQNSRSGPPGSPVKLPLDSADNPVYGRNQTEIIAMPRRQEQDNKHEVGDYATVDDAKPIYQGLVKENVRDSVYTPLNKETDEDYNHLQHPKYNPPQSKSDTLYNVLQRPNRDLQPGSHINENRAEASEPVYNVLEDPNANQHPQDTEPVYNVLEDPNQVPRDEPIYNVLEDPDADYDNAPIPDDQGSPAPGQDNLAYSSTIDLKRPQSLSSPNYDILEGPEGSPPDSTYQPLRIRTRNDNAPIDFAENIPVIPEPASSPDYHVLEEPEGSFPDSAYETLGIRTRDNVDVYQPLDRTSQNTYHDSSRA